MYKLLAILADQLQQGRAPLCHQGRRHPAAREDPLVGPRHPAGGSEVRSDSAGGRRGGLSQTQKLNPAQDLEEDEGLCLVQAHVSDQVRLDQRLQPVRQLPDDPQERRFAVSHLSAAVNLC